jgi:hypothetical protein
VPGISLANLVPPRVTKQNVNIRMMKLIREPIMNKKEHFINWMKRTKKSQLTIRRNIEYVDFYQNYLAKYKSKKIEEAKQKDLEDFKSWGEKTNLNNRRMYLLSMVTYYQFTNNIEMLLNAKELVGSTELAQYKLSDFHGIDKECIRTLKTIGIKTAKQLLDVGYTDAKRPVTTSCIRQSATLPNPVPFLKLKNNLHGQDKRS